MLPLAHREISEGVGAEAGAVQAFDVPTLTGKHPANLMVATFGEGEGGAAGAGDFEVGGEAGLGLAAEDEVAAGEGFDENGVKVLVHGDLVGFFGVGFGGGVAMDEGALVGDENQAAGFFVEAADRGDGGFAVEPGIGQKLIDVLAFGLAVGAAVTDGFVQHDENAVGGVERVAVDGDLRGVGLLIGAGSNDAVNVDAPFTDPGGGFTSAAIAEGGEDLIEAAHGGRNGIELVRGVQEEWAMKSGKRSGKTRGQSDHADLAEVRAVYAELETRLTTVVRDCQLSTRCCRFQLTGEVPVLTLGEALVAARGVRASGRRELKPHPEGACPLLGREGRCTIYEHRPFGCRTHFCRAAGGVVPRKLVADLIQRLEAVDEKLGGEGSRGLPEAIAAIL